MLIYQSFVFVPHLEEPLAAFGKDSESQNEREGKESERGKTEGEPASERKRGASGVVMARTLFAGSCLRPIAKIVMSFS